MHLFSTFLCSRNVLRGPARSGTVPSLVFRIFPKGDPLPQPRSLAGLLDLDVIQQRCHISHAAGNTEVCPKALYLFARTAIT